MHLQAKVVEPEYEQMELAGPFLAEDIVPHAAATNGHQHGAYDGIDLCPSCGSATLINIEGCKQCNSCGYSRCN